MGNRRRRAASGPGTRSHVRRLFVLASLLRTRCFGKLESKKKTNKNVLLIMLEIMLMADEKLMLLFKRPEMHLKWAILFRRKLTVVGQTVLDLDDGRLIAAQQ